MYFRTIKILAILLKWHRLLALHGIKSFPVSISSAVQWDPDPNWDIVVFHYSRIRRDYWQKLQIWQKFRVNMGLPTSSHTTEQTRGDKSLRASRKNSGGNRDAGMPVKAMTGRKKGFSRMFEPCWLLSGKGHQMLEITGIDRQRGWQGKRKKKPKGGDILRESLVRVWTLPIAKFSIHSTGRSTKEQKSVLWMPPHCRSPGTTKKAPLWMCLWYWDVVQVAQS